MSNESPAIMTAVNSAREVPAGTTPDVHWWRPYLDPLILVALGTFAVTQPLLSDFREGAGYFVARRNEPIEVVLLVAVLILAPGLFANLIVWAAAGFSEKGRDVAQTFFVGLFVALVAHTTIVRLTSVHWAVLMVVSLMIGALAAIVYRRSTWLKTYLTYLIPAPLIFALLFLFTQPVSGLVFPGAVNSVDATVGSRAPVVFVVFDEFPVASLLNAEGDIDATRYPNFAELASMSTWYKYTASAHEGTLWAVPAILSGEVPDNSMLPTAANYPGNLFTLLDRSHDLHVMEPFTFLCPSAMCGSGRSSSFADRMSSLIVDSGRLYTMMLTPDPASSPAVSDPFGEFRAGNASRVAQETVTDQVHRFDEFLDGIASPGPALHFVHLFLPHGPFRYYPSGNQYNNGDELPGLESEIWVEPALAAQAYQRHLLQVEAVDRMVGDLLAQLKSAGILDEAMVVVTADHGISFQPGEPHRPISAANAYEVGLVPLFIKTPHQEQGVVDTVPSRTIDILPTVADHLGLELPWTHEGQSLVQSPRVVATLSVQSRAGDEVPLDQPEQGLREATGRLQSLFGRNGVVDPYSQGDYDGVIGVPSFRLAAAPSELVARVDEPWRLAHVVPGLGFVPGFLRGDVAGSIQDNSQVAVALNGEVTTVVPVFDVDGDSARFSAIVPDDAFIPGFNDLELFALSGPSQGPSVKDIAIEGTTRFEAERSSTGQVTRIFGSNGQSWSLAVGSTIAGFVDEASWHDSGVMISGLKDLHLGGWAVDEKTLEPAERIVIFVNGVFAGSAGMDGQRPDIEEGYRTADVLISGFVGKLSQFVPAANLTVRAFALSDRGARELEITQDALSVITAG